MGAGGLTSGFFLMGFGVVWVGVGDWDNLGSFVAWYGTQMVFEFFDCRPRVGTPLGNLLWLRVGLLLL
jgi:hypothetical protein